jgi:Uncharacterised protein family (UPF0158)
MKVKLEDVVEGMELQTTETRTYLNLQTGEIVYVSLESLFMAEDEEDYENLPEWQQDEVKIAYDIVESFGKFAALPSQFDINEYDMMESFCYSLSDEKMQNVLLNAIRGRGAFRRFKDNVHRFEIFDAWYDYRDMKYKEIARNFCERHNIDYTE